MAFLQHLFYLGQILLTEISAAWRWVHWPFMALVSIAADRTCAVNYSLIQVLLRHILCTSESMISCVTTFLAASPESALIPLNTHTGFDLSNMHMMALLCQLVDGVQWYISLFSSRLVHVY